MKVGKESIQKSVQESEVDYESEQPRMKLTTRFENH